MYTQEQITQANMVSILAYARQHGYQTKKVGREYKIPGFGGLYINDDKNCFHCFSEKKEGGPIQFVMFMEGLQWKHAVAKLLDIEPVTYSRGLRYIQSKLKTDTVPPFFNLPPHGKTMNHVFAYLINTRKLDKDVVYAFVKRKMLYENEYGSCVFVGYDENHVPRCASIRGTGGKEFKQDVTGSCKEYFFRKEGSNDTLNVFESAIDLMSYITFQKRKSPLVKSHDMEDHYVALGCLDLAAMRCYLKQHPEVKRIRICLDNDVYGRKAGAALYYSCSNTYAVRLDRPKGKDWNEDLVKSG